MSCEFDSNFLALFSSHTRPPYSSTYSCISMYRSSFEQGHQVGYFMALK